MKKILFTTCGILLCSHFYLNAQKIGSMKILPEHPAQNDSIFLVTEVHLANMGYIIKWETTRDGKTIYAEYCYFDGFFNSPTTVYDEHYIGQLPPGTYTLIFKSNLSYSHSSCNIASSATDTITFRVSPSGVALRMGLAEISDSLVFNHVESPEGREYQWIVFFDSDDDISTGDEQGFDLAFSVSHNKTSGTAQGIGPLLQFTTHNILSFNNGRFEVLDTLYTDIDESSLIMAAPLSNTEVSAIKDGIRFMAKAYYQQGDTLHMDSTATGVLPGLIQDPEGDAGHPFIDIIRVEVSYPEVISGMKTPVKKDGALIFAPNPFTERSKIMFKGKAVPGGYTLLIYDQTGGVVKKVPGINPGENIFLEKGALRGGIYFYSLSEGAEIIKRGKLLIQD